MSAIEDQSSLSSSVPRARVCDDPENAIELTRTMSEAYSVFTLSQKRWISTLVAIAAFFSPLSANIYFPALSSLATDLNVSTEKINLTITSYMVFQGLAPTFFGDLADIIGRRPVYIILFIIYLGANIGLALQRNYAALLVLRMLQSTGSSGVIALASGVVADIAHSGERGKYMGAVSIGAMLGPAIGPVLGGILAEFLGWWWIFWLLVILSGVYLTILILFFPETARNVVGNGSIPASGINLSVLGAFKRSRRSAAPSSATSTKWKFPNPFTTIALAFEKDMGLVLFTNSIFYTAFYTVMASLPTLFKEIYGYNSLEVGLCYLPFGAGAAVSCVIMGKLVDRDYRVTARRIGLTRNKRKGDDMSKFPIEEARLHSIFWLVVMYVVMLITYGWVLQAETNVAGPLVMSFLIAIFGTGVFNILSTLIVDLYPSRPGGATACNNLIRCFMGAGGTAVIESMLNSMGRGWCFTFVGLVSACMVPLLLWERKCGMRWRLAREERQKAKKEKEELKKTMKEKERADMKEKGGNNLETEAR